MAHYILDDAEWYKLGNQAPHENSQKKTLYGNIQLGSGFASNLI